MDRFRVAIRPPQELCRRLQLCCCGLTDVSWFGPDNLLLTLRCFGDLQEAARLDLCEALEQVESAPLAIGLGAPQIGAGQRGGSVALPAHASEGLDQLLAKIDQVAKSLRLKSRAAERPRLILGTYAHNPGHIADYLQQFADLTPAPFVTTTFGFYRQHSSPKHTYFQEETVYSLGEAQRPEEVNKNDFPLL
jgi:2'-5' RNA ligase